MKPKGEIEMGRHEAYVWDSVSMEWRSMPLYEEGVRSEIRAEVPYAEFMERMGLERKPGLSWAERKRLRELHRTGSQGRRPRYAGTGLCTGSFSRGTASGARGPTGRCPYQARCSCKGRGNKGRKILPCGRDERR